MSTKIEELEFSLEKSQQENIHLKAMEQSYKDQCDELSLQLEQMQDQLHEQQNTIITNNETIQLLQQNTENDDTTDQKLKAQLEKLAKKHKKLRESYENLESKYNQLTSMQHKLESQLSKNQDTIKVQTEKIISLENQRRNSQTDNNQSNTQDKQKTTDNNSISNSSSLLSQPPTHDALREYIKMVNQEKNNLFCIHFFFSLNSCFFVKQSILATQIQFPQIHLETDKLIQNINQNNIPFHQV